MSEKNGKTGKEEEELLEELIKTAKQLLTLGLLDDNYETPLHKYVALCSFLFTDASSRRVKQMCSNGLGQSMKDFMDDHFKKLRGRDKKSP